MSTYDARFLVHRNPVGRCSILVPCILVRLGRPWVEPCRSEHLVGPYRETRTQKILPPRQGPMASKGDGDAQLLPEPEAEHSSEAAASESGSDKVPAVQATAPTRRSPRSSLALVRLAPSMKLTSTQSPAQPKAHGAPDGSVKPVDPEQRDGEVRTQSKGYE